jgi:hypothetical protein
MQNDTPTPSDDHTSALGDPFSNDALALGNHEQAAAAAAAELAAAQAAARQQAAASQPLGASPAGSQPDEGVKTDPPERAARSLEARPPAGADDDGRGGQARSASGTPEARPPEQIDGEKSGLNPPGAEARDPAAREKQRSDEARADKRDERAPDDLRDQVVQNELRRDTARDELRDDPAHQEFRDEVIQNELRRDEARDELRDGPARDQPSPDQVRDSTSRDTAQETSTRSAHPPTQQDMIVERPVEAHDRSSPQGAPAAGSAAQPAGTHEFVSHGVEPPREDHRDNRPVETSRPPDPRADEGSHARDLTPMSTATETAHPAERSDATAQERDQREGPARQPAETREPATEARESNGRSEAGTNAGQREAEASREQAEARQEQAEHAEVRREQAEARQEQAEARREQAEQAQVREEQRDAHQFSQHDDSRPETEALEREHSDARREQLAAEAKARQLQHAKTLHHQGDAEARALEAAAQQQTAEAQQQTAEAQQLAELQRMDAILGDQLGPLPAAPPHGSPYIPTAQEAFSGRFSDTPGIEHLWDRAAKDQSSFAEARKEFWRLVNNDDAPDAEAVRELLHSAGYETHTGTTNAPTMQLESYEAVRPEDTNRVRADLTLSIDHVDAQSRGGEKLKAENLRFMSVRDNSTRGAHYDTGDRPVDIDYDADGQRIFPGMSSQEQRERELFRERVEALLEQRRQGGGT